MINCYDQHVSLDNVIKRMSFCFVISCLHCDVGAIAIMRRDKVTLFLVNLSTRIARVCDIKYNCFSGSAFAPFVQSS